MSKSVAPWHASRRSFGLIAIVALGLAVTNGCNGDGSSDGGSTPPVSDTQPPSISRVVSLPSTQGARIEWITNEPADSQVEFGTTASYGSTSPLSTNRVTNHSVTISGLDASATYHFRVKSRDAAGNLASGSDMTFTTTSAPDTTPPDVSVQSPSEGASLSGSVTVVASASDESSVVGVQFRIDGANVGSEDATEPYSVTWDTRTVANGPHVITALAKDSLGNLATSAPINVTVDNLLPDTTPPTVEIAAPADGATLTGMVTVAADAADDVAVSGVQFLLDEANLGTEDLIAPYAISWDTNSASDGVHVLTARARDAAGNQSLSSSVSVSVDNAPEPGGPITVGDVEVDPPTLESIGLSLPIVSGDTNYNAVVSVTYREVGHADWREALPLMRVRPETLSNEDPTPFAVGEQFAGSIMDLSPDTSYEIMVEVRDPDSGGTTRSLVVRTRPVPPANPISPRTVPVSNASQLATALANAGSGDVIVLADGVYSGAITISKSGTEANPIYVRGQSRDGVIIDATGAGSGVTVTGNHVTIENVTVIGSSWGMRIGASEGVVVRRTRIANVSYGIDARGDIKRNFYICDNVLEGRQAVWPETGSAVWDYEGIVVTGAGHVICHNVLSGFGDALGLHQNTSIPNRAIDFYNNDVLWAGDNGIELDFSERNVRALRNRFTNGGNHSMSFQPIWGGPVYAIRNVMYNSATAPYKFNNEPTGIYVLHNTALRPGWAWVQYGARAANFEFQNNITIGTTNAVDMTTVISLAKIDYNGWLPDGQFRFTDTWTSFADLQGNSPYEHNGRLLNGMPFASSISIPVSHTTFVDPRDVALSSVSNANDSGVRLPNVNDDALGSGPDLGALESGGVAPIYGPR